MIFGDSVPVWCLCCGQKFYVPVSEERHACFCPECTEDAAKKKQKEIDAGKTT